MVKASRYSKENLLQYVNSLARKVYLFFYDLGYENFDDTINNLRNCLDIIETKIFQIRKESYLAIYGYLKFPKLKSLVMELDLIDISEILISEYQDNEEVINSAFPRNGTAHNYCKQIYVNKDEKIIQTYNM